MPTRLTLAGAAFLLALLSGGAAAASDPSYEGSQDAPTFQPGSVDERVEIPGEIAIDLRDDISEADLSAVASRYGVAMRPNSAWGSAHDKIEVAEVDPGREEELLSALARDPRVEHAEPMALYRALFVPDDPLYATKQWHLKRVGAERAWDYTCGEGVTVAVVDTGVACFDKGPFSRGTDLAGTRCLGGWNFVDDSPEAVDDQGHGTHVAGTIAQTTNNGVGAAGLAYCATLMPVKVLNKQGFGTVASVAEGIRFAADEGARVINLSLGGPIKSSLIGDAIAHALSRNVVIVAAAGNSGGSVGWPAAYPGVIAVSATDADDKIAWFSSRGPEVDIAAPGVGVTQQTICNGGRDRCEIFGTFNGTSMASPHVAGVAAMIEAVGVTRAQAVADVLASTARGQGDPKLYGAGIVDAGAAMAKVFWGRLAVRSSFVAVFLWLVGRRVRQRGGRLVRSPVAGLATLFASIGLFPVGPFAHVSSISMDGVAGSLARRGVRPFGEWDLALAGPTVASFWLFGSALPVLALAALGFANRRARPMIGGFELGTAAFLAQRVWSAEVAFVLGVGLSRVWAVGNIALCLWVARVGLEGKRA